MMMTVILFLECTHRVLSFDTKFTKFIYVNAGKKNPSYWSKCVVICQRHYIWHISNDTRNVKTPHIIVFFGIIRQVVSKLRKLYLHTKTFKIITFDLLSLGNKLSDNIQNVCFKKNNVFFLFKNGGSKWIEDIPIVWLMMTIKFFWNSIESSSN